MITANSRRQTSFAVELGADDYITKTFRLREISALSCSYARVSLPK
jgi:DNA-binding response OmpR family regulator